MKENNLTDTIQLRYAAEAMPTKDVSVRSRLGNCKTMEEAWVILEGEYGDPQDLLRDRLAKLSTYQPPKNTRSALTKFKDLMSTWREVRADLKEVTLLHKMDHDITFYDFTKHLGRDSAERWVAYEAAQPKNTTQTRSFIFDSWLDVELKILKSWIPAWIPGSANISLHPRSGESRGGGRPPQTVAQRRRHDEY